MIRPSSLPMLAACPSWQGDGGNSDTDAGSLRHDALAKALAGDLVPLQSLADDEQERVQWALDYVKTHAPDGHELRIEQRLSVMNDTFEVVIAGTPDATCGPELFDLKWRERDYTAQMAAYALAMIQENDWPTVRVHVLFAERKHAEVFTIDREEAEQMVFRIMAEAGSRSTPCDYCGWCSKRLTCPALTENVRDIVKTREGIEDEDREAFQKWWVEGCHASAITEDARLAGQILRIARQISEWCEAVEHHAKEMAIKQGVIPAGFKIQNRQGNRFIPSVTDAFARAGLPQDEFLKACEVKFSNLVEATAKLNGMKKAQAERTMEEKLGDALQRKASSVSLVKEKEAK